MKSNIMLFRCPNCRDGCPVVPMTKEQYENLVVTSEKNTTDGELARKILNLTYYMVACEHNQRLVVVGYD